MVVPLITYLVSPLLRAVSKKNNPWSFFAIPTPPCRVPEEGEGTLTTLLKSVGGIYAVWRNSNQGRVLCPTLCAHGRREPTWEVNVWVACGCRACHVPS